MPEEKFMKLFLLLILFFSISCGKEAPKKSSRSHQNISSIYSSGEIKIKVYYEPGAEPYTDTVLGQDLWKLTEMNLIALFEGRSIEVKVPKSLDQMTQIPSKGKSSWSVADVLALGKAHPINEVKGTTQFQIFFLNGYSDEGSGVIGFHISNTKIMAIFKDVIQSTGGNMGIVQKYVEQATLIHEMGHAFGLVNNGLPMQENHQDHEHGAHCKNPDCVMYYSNEGAVSMMSFAQRASTKGTLIMFDSQCLEDSRKYKK